MCKTPKFLEVKNSGLWGFVFAVMGEDLEKTVEFYIFCDYYLKVKLWEDII